MKKIYLFLLVVFAFTINTKIYAQYSNASLEGTWVPESENNPYIVVNSLGEVTEVGAFDASGPAGAATVNPDGSFSMILGTNNFLGQIDSNTRFHLFIEGNSSYWNKVTDKSALSGFINGKINPNGSDIAALFKVDNNGNVTNSYLNIDTTLYSGKVFTANGYYAGYIKNSGTDCVSQIMLTGSISGNTLSGKSKGYCNLSNFSNFTLLSNPSGTFSASNMEGSWVSPGENNPYLIFNSEGNLLEFGGFDREFISGSATINSDGTIEINGINSEGDINFPGQFQDNNTFNLITYDDEYSEFRPIAWNKVTNPAALQGTLTGNITVGGATLYLTFDIDNNGLITNSNLRTAGLYTGRILTSNGHYAGLIKNGGTDKFSIIKLSGTISGSSLTGWSQDNDPNDNSGTSSFTLSTLSTNDLVYKDLKIHPNPVKDYLYIETLEKIIETKIYNIQGNLMNHFLTPNKTLNLNHLKKGIYIIEIKTDKGSKSIKFIKE